ncbi:T9SS type A sorting domain-containing protein [candidate division WOR-3 bacterium]|nr:T9SS type A sorting domain-containing protein [candidate division WOR-3 bacterium]
MNRFNAFIVPIFIGMCLLAGAGRLHADAEVLAWGYNCYGQLGDSTTIDRCEPVQTHITNTIAIVAGRYHSLALKSDSTVWAWGWNLYGQIGDSTDTTRLEPVQAHNLTDAIAITGGSWHSLALKSDSTVWAWGSNYYGQLGDSTNTDRWEPVKTHIPGVIAISAGYCHSLALKSNGTVWGWGDNYYGELGDSTTTSRWEPVKTHNLTDVIAISGGEYHSLAIGELTGVEEYQKSNIKNQNLKVYPNPFTAVVSVKCLGISEGQKVSLKVYDLSGRLIKTFNTNHLPLTTAVSWDGKDKDGKEVKSGIYFLKVKGYEPVKLIKLR